MERSTTTARDDRASAVACAIRHGPDSATTTPSVSSKAAPGSIDEGATPSSAAASAVRSREWDAITTAAPRVRAARAAVDPISPVPTTRIRRPVSPPSAAWIRSTATSASDQPTEGWAGRHERPNRPARSAWSSTASRLAPSALRCRAALTAVRSWCRIWSSPTTTDSRPSARLMTWLAASRPSRRAMPAPVSACKLARAEPASSINHSTRWHVDTSTPPAFATAPSASGNRSARRDASIAGAAATSATSGGFGSPVTPAAPRAAGPFVRAGGGLGSCGRTSWRP